MALISEMTERTGRFGALLVAILLDFLLAPIVMTSRVGMIGERFLAGLVLVAALVVARARPTSIGLFLFAAGTTVYQALDPGTAAATAAAALRLLFLGYVFVLIIREVLSDRAVSYDTIAGAACAYVLFGIAFAQVYVLVELLAPGSFEIPASFTVGPDGDQRASLAYFSLATLTTVGYGDIHPTRPGVGALAVTEAIVGQLYLAVTVARLVGLHTAHRAE